MQLSLCKLLQVTAFLAATKIAQLLLLEMLSYYVYLACPLLGETYAEHAQHVAVSGLHLHMSLNQCLPFTHQTA